MTRLRHALVGVLSALGLLEPLKTAAARFQDWQRARIDSARKRRAILEFGRYASADIMLVEQNSRWLLARVGDATVVDTAHNNCDRLLSCLDLAGIGHVTIPIESVNRYRVAVAVEQRDQVWDALSGQAENNAYVYVDLRPRTDPIHLSSHRGYPGGDALEDASVWRFFLAVTDSEGQRVMGDLHGCEIEFWASDGQTARASRWNKEALSLPLSSFPETYSSDTPFFDEPSFPVDIVFTWVDGDDAAWQSLRREYEQGRTGHVSDAASKSRYESRDELRYALRSVEFFADFARTIYIVTDRQRPEWLEASDRVQVIDHSEIFPAPALPVFNSHAIEARLHHIPGLAEHFVYMNDDFLLGRRVTKSTFFFGNGISKSFLSTALIHPTSHLTVDIAARNSQKLMLGSFGRRVTQKIKHAPYALRRSVLFEIEERFPEEVTRTVEARFRARTDLPIPSSFYHYYAYVTGRALAGEIVSRYIDLSGVDFEAKASGLLRRRAYDSVCVNDGGMEVVDQEARNHEVSLFLDALQPSPASFERLS